MEDENKGHGSLSIMEAAEKLRQSREAPAEPEVEDTPEDVEEIVEDQVEAETDAEEESEDDAEEIAEGDDPEADDEEDAEPEDDDALYEVGGEQFTLAELREWKKGGLLQADYTKKTQELSEAKKAFEGERQTWEAEREQVQTYLREQDAQLKDALATFAIEQDPKPKRSEYGTTDEFLDAQEDWTERQEKRARAKQAFQALQAQQHNELRDKESAQLLRHFPEWRDPAVFDAKAKEFTALASEYGFAAEEVEGLVDHRMFRILNDLHDLKSDAGNRKKSAQKAAKKVAKAVKPLAAGAKPAKNQESKEVRQSRERLRKTGSMADAAAALRARRRAG